MLESNRDESPAFFDIEASGLNGLPIEIGWAIPDVVSGMIVSSSLLIRPPDDWSIEEAWDPVAEDLHRISTQEIMDFGQAPAEVILAMNQALTNRTLFSDAPLWDLPWLEQIVRASDISAAFSASRRDARSLIGDRARASGWLPEEFHPEMLKVLAENPTTHRAEADARQLAALWLIAFGLPIRSPG